MVPETAKVEVEDPGIVGGQRRLASPSASSLSGDCVWVWVISAEA